MKLNPTRHEDHRRILVEYNKDIPMKRAKIITAKENCTLGNHYHRKNDSIFYIASGKGLCILKDLKGTILKREWMFEGDCIFVPTEVVHTFQLRKGTVLLELASETYNGDDEIQYP